MQSARGMRYVLFGLIFAFVLIGLILHSYPLLVVMVITAIILAVFADKWENAPSEPYKHHNALHHKAHHEERE
jgi:hypothetical protein